MQTETPISEAVLVEGWRIQQFTLQGFSTDQVTELLLYNVDQHDTENLLTKGCSHSLALSILRG